MNWMVYFVGGSRDLQKHVMEHPRPVYECAAMERLIPSVSNGAIVERAITYQVERYSFRPLRDGLGVYLFEEMV